MRTKVQKWGNSLGVRLPKGITEEAGLKEGTPVALTVERGRVVVAPLARTYKLEDLLRLITPDNIHGEVDFGKPQGREIW